MARCRRTEASLAAENAKAAETKLDPTAIAAAEHEATELRNPTDDGVAAALATSDLLSARLPDIVRARSDLADRVAQHREHG